MAEGPRRRSAEAKEGLGRLSPQTPAETPGRRAEVHGAQGRGNPGPEGHPFAHAGELDAQRLARRLGPKEAAHAQGALAKPAAKKTPQILGGAVSTSGGMALRAEAPLIHRLYPALVLMIRRVCIHRGDARLALRRQRKEARAHLEGLEHALPESLGQRDPRRALEHRAE